MPASLNFQKVSYLGGVLVLSEDYFKKRLIDIYDYSILPYKSGTGVFLWDGDEYYVRWGIVVSVTGEPILVISIPRLSKYSPDQHNHRGCLNGESDDGLWKIIAAGVIVYESRFVFDNKANLHLICGAASVDIKRNAAYSEPSHIIGYLLNFDFSGLEVSQKAKGWVRDKFTVIAHDRNIVFRNSSHKMDIKKQVRSKRIDRAVFSTVNIPLKKGEKVDLIEDYLRKISCFLSLLNVNLIMSPVVEHWADDKLVGVKYYNYKTLPYRYLPLIDNDYIDSGLRLIFEECYTSFLELNEKLNLTLIIKHLSSMHNADYMEHKLAILIMAYEYLLYNYLLEQGYSAKELEDLNMQRRLGRLNKIMRFNPKKLQEDTFRNEVRNPLFHMGLIPNLTSDERRELFSKYYDLLIQILLRLLDYTGSYISPINYKPVSLL